MESNVLDSVNQDLNGLFFPFKNSNSSNQSSSELFSYYQSFQHIIQPASYVPGITLFAYKDSSLFKDIMLASELPIIRQDNIKAK